MLAKLKTYVVLMRLNRPIGILLLLWPTLWALWIAGAGHPDYKIVLIFIAGVVVMRSAGCIINDIADRNFDHAVARTQHRPITAKKVTVKEALILFVFLCVVAFLLVIQLNIFTIKLSLVALALAIIYPFTKRFTHLPQLILGAAFAWSVPMAFTAQTNSLPFLAWYLFFIAWLWPVIYDTMYAMADLPEDIKIGVKSTAILFGNQTRLILAILQVLFLLLLLGLGWYANLTFWFYLSVIIVAGFAIYQQYLIKDHDPALCFRAFLNNQWLGLVIFIGLWLSYFSL